MFTEEDHLEVQNEIYRRLYAEATPSADFDEMVEYGLTKVEGWYNGFYLSEERTNEIIEEVCDEMDAPESARSSISSSVLLGGAPVYKSNYEGDSDEQEPLKGIGKSLKQATEHLK